MKSFILLSALFFLGIAASAQTEYQWTNYAGGGGGYGSTDGTGVDARFTGPEGLTRDGSGNFYVADTLNNSIRKVTAAGVVSTLAGHVGSLGSADGIGPAAYFNNPEDVAVDLSGNVYVADTMNHTIRKVTPAGLVSTLAGSPGVSGSLNGNGSGARFNHPESVAVDSGGNVYVADTYNHTIRKITPTGDVTTLAGSPGSSGNVNATGSVARFYFPKV